MAGVGLSSLATIVNEVAQAIVENLWELSVAAHFPQDEAQFEGAFVWISILS